MVKPKPSAEIYVEEKCAGPGCGKSLLDVAIKYRLRIQGKESPYCQECAKKILRPQENLDEGV